MWEAPVQAGFPSGESVEHAVYPSGVTHEFE